MVNIDSIPLHKHQELKQFIQKIESINHPNLLNLIGKALILDNINTIALRTEAPDHISTWKQFSKI